MGESTQPLDIVSAYDQWSESYDEDDNKTRDLAAHALRQTNLQIENCKVIEIGCGTGRNTVWLAERAASITAIDFSQGMLDRARERLAENGRVKVMQHDILTSWPVQNDSADVVIVMLVLEHVQDLDHVFREAHRTLRAGGRLFMCELHPLRQLLGGQAQFTNAASGERQKVTAFFHDVSDYVNGAINAGLAITRLDEWRDDANISQTPRLFSMLSTRQM